MDSIVKSPSLQLIIVAPRLLLSSSCLALVLESRNPFIELSSLLPFFLALFGGSFEKGGEGEGFRCYD